MKRNNSPLAIRSYGQATRKRSLRLTVWSVLLELGDAFALLSTAFGFILFMLCLTFGTLWFVAWMVEHLKGVMV